MYETLYHRSRPKTDFASVDWDMVFPDDEREARPTSFKFLQTAHLWKQMQAAKAASAVAEAPEDSVSDTEMKNGDAKDAAEEEDSDSDESS